WISTWLPTEPSRAGIADVGASTGEHRSEVTERSRRRSRSWKLGRLCRERHSYPKGRDNVMNPDESNEFFREHLTTKRAMVILRGMEPGAAVILAAKAWDAGVSLVEVPLQNDRDVESLREVIEAGADRGCYTGAGTIISKRHADKAADAGAKFTVAPGFS